MSINEQSTEWCRLIIASLLIERRCASESYWVNLDRLSAVVVETEGEDLGVGILAGFDVWCCHGVGAEEDRDGHDEAGDGDHVCGLLSWMGLEVMRVVGECR
jgi:hypothetical protein